jgi:hypothetical protein
MNYISIGSNCSVKYNIDKYRCKHETLFFDWLMTSMNSVIDILRCDNIKDILYFENIITDPNKPVHNNNKRIIIKSLDFCVSIHDVPINNTDSDIFNFIDKYTRRFNRIIDCIKSNEPICFIRLGYANNDEINKFIQTIKNINPDCDFTVVIIHNDKKNNSEIVKHNNLLYIKLNIDTIESDWTQQFLNWDKLFLDIENNI